MGIYGFFYKHTMRKSKKIGRIAAYFLKFP